jgi:hypothetical protein
LLHASIGRVSAPPRSLRGLFDHGTVGVIGAGELCHKTELSRQSALVDEELPILLSQLCADYFHFSGSIEPNSNLVDANCGYNDFNFVANQNAFADSAGQNQHMHAPSY